MSSPHRFDRPEDYLYPGTDVLRNRLDVRNTQELERVERALTLGRLVASPRSLWLLDEPLAPLDARWRERIGALMAEHLAGGGLIIAAVHDPLPVPSREVSL